MIGLAVALAMNAQSLTIIDTDGPTLDPGEDLTITVEYRNHSSQPVNLEGFELYAQAGTAISPTSVYSWMSDVTTSWHIADADGTYTVPARDTLTTTITIPREELPWDSGPRGIEVRAVGSTASDRTMITVAPDDVVPYPATVVVPVTSSHQSPINELLWQEEPTASQAESLADYPGLTLLVDPMLKTNKPTHAQRLALPPYDADIAALVDAGRADQIPEGDDVFLPAGLPSLESLEVAASKGLHVLIPDAVYPPARQLTYTPSAVTTLPDQHTPAIATHSVIGSAINGKFVAEPGDAELDLDALDRRQVTVALSAVHQRQRPNDPRPIVVALERGATDEQFAAAQELLSIPWVEPVGLTEISAGEPAPVERVFIDRSEPGPLTADALNKIDAELAKFDALSSIFPDGDNLSAKAREQASFLTGARWREDSVGLNKQISQIAPTPDQLSAISVTTSSPINMISESSELPIPVTNGFNQPAKVTVHLDTPDNRLVATEAVEAELPPGTTTVSIPVEAHGSGNIDAKVYVTNSAGDLVGSPDTLHVRVRADWESTGTVIIASLIGLIFVVGVVKSIRDGRRSEPIEPDDFVAATKRS
ncbi:DUF6049 family protein [Trueperella bialowiezensis]|uniref:Uncharacterized protein n=1 Tax=Trueperella bialowiezensis TaxID=312285 RepID=A0A448PEG2_9ACTO|nr:DUF6049 family protein [Trueperella bialowiezensis]VEI13335.1 Uncharacterised protein [Trueperella bialowiezensis]